MNLIDYRNLPDENFFIVGPCVIENYDILSKVAEVLCILNVKFKKQFIFKASIDKANRTSISSFRGKTLDEGLKLLDKIMSEFDLPITTDVHESYQAEAVGQVFDSIQIPAFLCRQTDLFVSSAKTGKIVNIKKAQFLSVTSSPNTG